MGTVNAGGPPNTPFQSHPSTVGYVRGNQSSGSAAGTEGALMDSGTRDGTPTDELDRLGGVGQTAEENPTSSQPAPNPRSQQNPVDQQMAQGGDDEVDPTALTTATVPTSAEVAMPEIPQVRWTEPDCSRSLARTEVL